MIAPEKVQLLQGFLGGLPAPVAARLAKAIEVDRLSDGKQLPHDLILDGLRPVLRQAEPSRTLTPLRIFCRPFEDLLYNRPRKQKQKGRIARDTISPLWIWLEQGLLPAETKRYIDGVKEAVFGYQREVAMSHAAAFWPVAAAAIQDALGTEAGAKAARQALGGDLPVADAREAATLLSAGPEILEIQALLTPPAASLPDDLLWSLREIYHRIVAKSVDVGPYVPVVVMARLERPWEALKVPLFVSRQSRDTLISSTDMGLVGEVLFAELDHHIAAIRSARHPAFEVEALIGSVAAFAELSMGLVKEVEMRRDGQWGQRLMKSRAAVAEAMEALIERAPREILATLPMHRAGFTGGPRAPDLSKAPDAEKRERARIYARLVVGCRPFSAAASFGAAIKDVADEVTGTLCLYVEDLLRDMRACEGDKRAHAEAYFDLAMELTGLFLSQEEADLLRRRGRAALAPAAA